jgi:cytochrome c oxidase assembly factor CtaG
MSFEPAVVVPAAIAAGLHLRGWATLARRMPERFGPGRPVAFMAGLATVLLALSAPLDELGHQSLRAHMIQHLLLMLVAPPLLWMGAPVAPMLLGLPRPVRRVVAAALAWPAVRRLTRVVADPRLSWAAFVIALWAWHVPALYDLALRSDPWHHVEHVCFLVTALLFWRPVILPWPARSPWPRWAMIPYLVLASFQNGVLGAIFTFSDRVIYAAYASIPGSALEDQAMAGLIMWVPGSMAFLLPVLWLIVTSTTSGSSGPVAATPRAPAPSRCRSDA